MSANEVELMGEYVDMTVQEPCKAKHMSCDLMPSQQWLCNCASTKCPFHKQHTFPFDQQISHQEAFLSGVT